MTRDLVTRFVAIAAALISSIASPKASAAESAEQWGIYELALTGPRDGNPFVDVEVGATFSKDQQAIKVNGFYDGDGIYRIRFMPETTGIWSYRTTSNRPELADKSGDLTVTPPSLGNHGPVRVAHTYHFAHTDGTPFRPIGTTCYGWAQRPEQLQEQTLKSLSASPFNKVRMLLMPQNQEPEIPAPQSPFAGTAPKQWDFTRYNPAFFHHLEKRIGQLRDHGIECDLILFHPYGRMWGMDDMDDANDDRYLRYVVSRLASYRNVWWSLANEYDFLRWKEPGDWDRFFQIVQQSDPYGHLRSIHNGYEIYNATLPWVTHASIQCGAAVEEPGRAEILRSAFRKPVVYDEVKYEGNIDKRWGQLDGRDLIHRIWSGTVVGTYVSHGEALKDTNGSWLSKGGTFRGESPERIAFLKTILKDAPAGGIDPVDKWQQPAGMGGQPGHYYLLYFGREAPKTWPFELYKSGLRDGMQFQVEIIDTWDMTVTAVQGCFVTKRKNAYHFADELHRAVELPGKPGIVLRIRRIGDTSGDPVIEEPNE